MEYAVQLPTMRKMLVPVAALVIGAAGAVGGYAVLDDTDVGVQPTRVIVTDAPAPPSSGVAAKDEAGTAAAIAGWQPLSSSVGKDEAGTAAVIANSGPLPSSFGKDEAKTATAIGNPEPPPSTSAKDEAKTAAAVAGGIPSPSAAERAQELQTDPHGGKSLRR